MVVDGGHDGGGAATSGTYVLVVNIDVLPPQQDLFLVFSS